MRTRDMKRRWVSVLVVLAACILVIPSCKKSPSANTDEQPAKVDNAPAGKVESPAAVEAVKAETVKAVEAAKVEVAPAIEAVKTEAVAAVTETVEAVKASAGGMVAIPLKLPKPMFVGTPANISGVPNLEKPLGKARAPFLAPAGVTNVAFEKEVLSSDDEPVIGEISYITDGDKEATDLSSVELGPTLQHVTIDLGAKCDIYAVAVWHFHRQPRVYFDVIVQVSDDPDFITDVQTIFNNDHDNSAGLGIGKDMNYVETNEGKLIDAKGVQGRYVRLYSRGNNANDYNHYIEVEVFGKPVK